MAPSKKNKFYAVLNGVDPGSFPTNKIGIFQTWEQARQRVEGFPNAKHRSFSSLSEATTYCLTSQGQIPALLQSVIDSSISRFGASPASIPSTSSSRSAPAPKPKTAKRPPSPSRKRKEPDVDSAASADFLTIYTDGACPGNGKSNPRAGLGVWFGPNDSRNLSERVVQESEI
jgi:ribonuclease HI